MQLMVNAEVSDGNSEDGNLSKGREGRWKGVASLPAEENLMTRLTQHSKITSLRCRTD